MSKPYKEVSTLNAEIMGQYVRELTSIVVDQDDFDNLCDAIASDMPTGMLDEHLTAIRKAKIIPLMMRGTKTESHFDRFDVKTQFMAVIVRGAGRQIFEKIINRTPPDVNMN